MLAGGDEQASLTGILGGREELGVVMNIAQELRERVSAFVECRGNLRDLQTWLAAHVQAIADADDPQATRLSDELWILIAECGDRLRDEDSVRVDLAELLSPEPAAARPATPIQGTPSIGTR